MANRGQDQAASRFWTTPCARRYSRLLLLLLDFDCVAVGLTQLGSLGIKLVGELVAPVSQKLEAGN
jgi:hypothetical protein